ncbi:MAG: 2-oxo acid dehydrogenase subunit E2 [Myxococcota bacterium]
MKTDENQLGVNRGYVAWIRAQWRGNPSGVQPDWQDYLAAAAHPHNTPQPRPAQNLQQVDKQQQHSHAQQQTQHMKQTRSNSTDLTGIAKQIASNMQASLQVPTATSCRDLPTKVLEENRLLINQHLQQQNRQRCSFTHLIAYAIVQAIKQRPALHSYCQQQTNRFSRVTPGGINLGLAMDLPAGALQRRAAATNAAAAPRMLVVPNIKQADTLSFAQWLAAYNDLLQRARAGKLQPNDFAGTLVTVTNPGTLGTVSSLPRLMQQQALIVATGRIGYPAWSATMDPQLLQQLGISKVMTLTSTYDHRIIQGAESGQFLADVHGLLMGEKGFYDNIFAALALKQAPYKLTTDQQHPPFAIGAPFHSKQPLLQPQQNLPQPQEGDAQLQQLAQQIRSEGHLWANINPLQSPTPWPLAQQAASLAAPAQQQLQLLQQAYMGSLSPECMHLPQQKRSWWIEQIEQKPTPVTAQQQLLLLQRLIQAESFAHFLHKRFVGHKRFGMEGTETLLVIFDSLLQSASRQGVQQVGIAMAHRGRLNILAHILGKPYREILMEFDANFHIPGFSGDVKYHMGYLQKKEDLTTSAQLAPHQQEQSNKHQSSASSVAPKNSPTDNPTNQQSPLTVWLGHNPSHLEAAYPVLLGTVRARQDMCATTSDPHAVLGIAVHGDASFAGQGVVYESLQLSRLSAYNTRGSVHVIVDNQIGYTTPPSQGRSTRYCSDLAYTFGLPVLHVNADDPQACRRAAQLAMQYRQQFHEDVIIHLLAYRRNGHNEADDPSITQPQLYRDIDKHPSVATQYGQQLLQQRVVSAQQLQQIKQTCWNNLDQAAKDAARKSKQQRTPPAPFFGSQDSSQQQSAAAATSNNKQFKTAVAQEMLRDLGQQLTQLPADFQPHSRVEAHVLQRRRQMMQTGQQLDFGMSEQLAYASLLAEGRCIRLCGQDSQRGTFAHRHAVLHSATTSNSYMPLQQICQRVEDAQKDMPAVARDCTTGDLLSQERTQQRQRTQGQRTQCFVYNSSLSEAAALGFEYGYSVSRPQALVIWEAQFGDFCNGAQVHIDQFIAAGQAKWNQLCRLVLMLPHGYEGQGPEHSSARLERFLQLCAQDNLRVVTCIRSCQLFHLLRQHAHVGNCPLVLFMPKSLLRAPQASCKLSELSTASFQPVFGDSMQQIKQAKRLVLCSGKIFWELDAMRQQHPKTTPKPPVALLQLQQLYPFPYNELRKVLQYCPAKEIVWLQEEPANMGASRFCAPLIQTLLKPDQYLRYIGRHSSASPATGYAYVHKQQQKQLLQAALAPVQRNAKEIYV